jgi:transcriptional regulator with XRE-family HTH domain
MGNERAAERTPEMTEFLKQFGSNIRRLRTAKQPHISQERLALETGLHRTEVGKLERGVVEPRLSTMMILARGLDASLDDLVAGLEVPDARKPPARGERRRDDLERPSGP